ncbi:pyridoxal phosphate-dependent decarboxylase family protein [Haladaptatus sp. CMSO5]|uniref:pyridoxal phosphate-dependent decarboxylase family protein n=1 Tax=Haladaptatus sp. CMSO5 TaxID=3120514 RepID=UPI002FCE4280
MNRDPETLFSHDAYGDALRAAIDALPEFDGPYTGASYDELETQISNTDPLPESGSGLATACTEAEQVLADSVDVTDTACIAHLQCPPVAPAIAAEALIAATNQSLDSFDQAPAATALEQRMVERLCSVFGFAEGDGVFTSGGTESNLQGLLLARDVALEARGIDPRRDGLTGAEDFRILCSEAAHFTATQAARILGLGESAVVEVPTDEDDRIALNALDELLDSFETTDETPIALVATAGTTDFGAIDPLAALADRTVEHDLWFHIDAAYGGALAFSERHKHKLDGIDRADSISVDFHKLLYQPLGCGAFLVKESGSFETLARDVAYLDPEGDGPPNLVAKSLRTSRRFDALKPYLTFRALGSDTIASFAEHTIALAAEAGDIVRTTPDLELATEPQLTTVVFRHTGAANPDELNETIRERLFDDGTAVLARTEVDGDVYLKFTLLNPKITRRNLETLFQHVCEAAATPEVVA